MNAELYLLDFKSDITGALELLLDGRGRFVPNEGQPILADLMNKHAELKLLQECAGAATLFKDRDSHPIACIPNEIYNNGPHLVRISGVENGACLLVPGEGSCTLAEFIRS